MQIKLAICAGITCTITQTASADTPRRCTDRTTVLYTNVTCPEGWIEVIGNHQGDIRKISPPAKNGREENRKIEDELRKLEQQSKTPKRSE